jgi:hypothetical protein
MTKLSVCIPVEPGMAPPLHLLEVLLENQASDLEIVISCLDQQVADALHAVADARLRVLAPAPANTSAAGLWLQAVKGAEGDWITLVYPEDMIEPDLPRLLSYVEREHPDADALGWNAFQIAPDAAPEIKTNIPLPIVHHVSEVDKTQMLQAFFQWAEAQRTPRMPFGLYHAAIKRSLRDAILAATGPLSWLTPVPQYEWAARVAVFASGFALANRPLSAASVTPFRSRRIPSALHGFPFDASLGLTAAIAEVQARVLHELGAEWNGFNENFVRACMLDCMLEHDNAAFLPKCEGYYAAFHRMPGGAELAPGFQPHYLSQPPADPRRGVYGKTLLVDRFIGGARTAQDFFRVISMMMAPIAIVTENPELLIQSSNPNHLVPAA